MLAGMGLFKEIGQNTFTSTPTASVYVTGSPLREAVIHMFVIRTILQSYINGC